MTSPSYAALRTAGRQAFADFELVVLARTPSTQDRVRAAARGGAMAGYCCVAAEQTAGRGRQGRTWTAPPGTSLLASVLVDAGGHPTAIPLATGLAVRDALTTFGVVAHLKWPNDILVEGRKLAGILVEVEPKAVAAAVVIGIGVNLRVESFPADLAAVSLHELSDAAPDWPDLLAVLLGALRRRLDAVSEVGVAAIREDWRAAAVGLGVTVSATTPQGVVHGVAVNIDEDGALLIEGPTGRIRLVAGDVHING